VKVVQVLVSVLRYNNERIIDYQNHDTPNIVHLLAYIDFPAVLDSRLVLKGRNPDDSGSYRSPAEGAQHSLAQLCFVLSVFCGRNKLSD
jgi:hypothetical protein